MIPRHLLVVLMSLLFSIGAHADTVIDFHGLSGANGANFSSYSENGYDVRNSAGQYRVANVFGHPAPSLYGVDSSSITISAIDGSAFTFLSADFAEYGRKASYSITGLFDGTQIFSQTGSIPSEAFSFNTYFSAFPNLNLTSLVISESGSDYNVDNIALGSPASVTPEPSSLALFATGLLGLICVGRRRYA